ncbi:MAG TPA: alpha/beta hydrolase [Candidatus Deferrimicrobiaceae bacterium]|nr:alpha/beta hydrolase [Candidatus Deferrimicrobiaceae bacterium]
MDPSATPTDLPTPVAAALARPDPPRRGTIEAAGYAWATAAWGEPSDSPLLLVHGVTSDAGIWWRVGPALAAAGRHAFAFDMPGHGLTGGWRGRHRFVETAADVATFVRDTGLDRDDLAVLGHSWGAVVAAHLFEAGIRPATLVLLDPPALTRAELEALMDDPTERPYPSRREAVAAVRAANPAWSDGDVEAKAEALCRFDPDAVRAILLGNGAWDAALAALRAPVAAGIPAWLIRGEWASGCLIPDERVPGIAAQLGAERVITIPGAPHSPQRTHPAETVAAVLHALAG